MSNNNITSKFVSPISISGVDYTHFEMRESTIGDLFEAEQDLSKNGSGAHTPLLFNGRMMALQITKVSNDEGETFAGPFTLGMLKQWGTHNYRVLRSKQVELDLLGEVELSDPKST